MFVGLAASVSAVQTGGFPPPPAGVLERTDRQALANRGDAPPRDAATLDPINKLSP
jgi:hypothetical protein